MPATDYPADLAKRDPLTVYHIKIPKSIIPVFRREGQDRQRQIQFMIREVLVEAAKRFAKEHERVDAGRKASVVSGLGKVREKS